MDLLVEFHKDNLDLARAEFESLTGKPVELVGSLGVGLCSTKSFFPRLAYTRRVFELIARVPRVDLIGRFQGLPWSRIVKGSFCVRVYPKEFTQDYRPLAKIIFHSIKAPSVDLDDPRCLIAVFMEGKEAFIGRLLFVQDASFEARKAHLRPDLKPISLHPKLARAMVNLTGVKNGVIFDPCCGTGGILLEAQMMGLKMIGSDIDAEMVEISKRALGNDVDISQEDCLMHRGTHRYVVSDLPYSRNTKDIDLGLFYDGFLDRLKVWKTKTAVLGFPDFIDAEALFKKHHLAERGSFTIYLHKSLSKRIFKIVIS